MALREEGGRRVEPEWWTDTEHARMVGERVRMEEVEEGGQMTGEGQSGHVGLTQIGRQVPDLYQEIKITNMLH